MVKKNKGKKHHKEKEFSPFWEKVEHINAKLITPAILVLTFVIVVELFFKDFAHHYHTPILVMDYFVLVVFVIDLIFLGIRAKSVKFFFKHYWLDLLAVIPMALMFTFVSKIYRALSAAGKIGVGQAILHETLEIRKGVSAATRSGRIAKFMRLGARSLRVITKSRLFTHVHFKHHLAKRGKSGKKKK